MRQLNSIEYIDIYTCSKIPFALIPLVFLIDFQGLIQRNHSTQDFQ